MDFYEMRAAMIGGAEVATTFSTDSIRIVGKITAIIYRRDENGRISCTAEIKQDGKNGCYICRPEKINLLKDGTDG